MERHEISNLDEVKLPLADRKVMWIDRLIAFGEQPPDGDKILAAFGYAAAAEIAESELGNLVTETLTFRPHLTSLDGTNLMLRAFQKQLLRVEAFQYPNADFEETSHWQSVIQTILADENMKDDFLIDMLVRKVQSNIAARYAAHKLIMLTEQERLGTSPQLLDIGTSDMQGPTKLAINHPFEKVAVVQPYPGKRQIFWNDDASTRVINRLLSKKLKLGMSVGTDSMPIRNTKKQHEANTSELEWIRACSFRGQEFNDQHRVQEFNTLHAATTSNLFFYQGDFSETGMALFAVESPVQRFDIVSFTTVLYLMSPVERAKARELAKSFVKPEGLIIYQDFIHKQDDDKSKFEFFSDWGPFTYRTMIEDPKEQSGELHEILWSVDGRYKRLALGPDVGKLALGQTLKLIRDNY